MDGIKQVPLELHSLIMSPLVRFALTIVVIFTSHANQAYAFCPKRCICDETKLEVTCLESTGLQAVPHTFNPQTQKIVINFANATLFSGLDLYGQLEILDLSHNNITSIDFRVLNQNRRLHSFNSSHNMVSSLADSTVNPRRGDTTLDPIIDEEAYLRMIKFDIQEIHLSHNRLSSITNFLFLRMPNLRHLDISYNSIMIIEHHAFVGNHKIDNLNLRGNRLTQVPTSPISSMALRFSGNNLSPLDTRQLKRLDLSENPITQLQPSAFPPLGLLMELYMEYCGVQRIDARAFRNIPNLMLLSLDHNQLEEINDGSFEGMPNLKRLELSSNLELSNFGKSAFANMPNLRYLNLNSNSIESLRAGISNLPHLTILDMRGNPIECQCDIQWLGQWLRDFDNKTKMIQNVLKQTSENNSIENSVLLSTTPSSTSRRKRDIRRNEQEFDAWLSNPILTRDLVDLRCVAPVALSGRLLIELHRDKLECLEPMSQLHVTIGLIILVLFATTILAICIINVCKRRKYLFKRLKNNLVMKKIDSPTIYDSKFKEMSQMNTFTPSIYAINTDAHDFYDTNLSYGQIEGPIYHQPIVASADYDSRTQSHQQQRQQRAFTDL
ncbi:Leucine-rich repeat transmembrane neuronal protein 2 [Fragariocoptes setiger]|uniref:Leucine-rich repeat transmembrane neuronal protein 2 n=1 Tax=Fragariocoptes setiger TaxID=1670756 RepID=A0ABQ7SCU4_9ACAR|nr:Leucine-rich repeat transmembrane neuronal protein 2 [Fragariocoptes setiger]